MKNIVICCDGTSNDFGENNSNVVKLYSVLEKNTEHQLVYYDPGVGTPSTYDGFNPLTKKLKYALGMGFGYGLTQNITDAYKFLMNTYEEGDKLYFFGFSRGAYTVRALAGLIDICGLLHANNENLIPEAIRIYKNRQNKVSNKFEKTFSRKCKIHFLGLWDTVTSVGWIYDPVTLQSTTNNPKVEIVRHAISIDERRAFFRQNMWGERYKKFQDIKQVWFAGVHSDVGGSYPEEKSNLSNIALEWMLVEARENGLRFGDLTKIRKRLSETEKPYNQDLNKSLTLFWYVAEIWPKLVWRKKEVNGKSKWYSRPYFNLGRNRYLQKDKRYTLHEAVLKRINEREDYQPKSILRVCLDLGKITDHFDIEEWVRL